MTAPLRTLGVDLAAQPTGTATCAIEWAGEEGRVMRPEVGKDDEALLAEMASADWVGVDAPFGWPVDFVEAVAAYTREGAWPEEPRSQRLRLRETDNHVRERIAEQTGLTVIPMSASVDKLGACALRCAGLLVAHAERTGWELDRTGTSPSRTSRPRAVIEAYPAGSLALWGLPHRRYKGPGGRALRQEIVDGLAGRAGPTLLLEHAAREECLASDHATDALITAVMAWEAAAGRTELPSPGQVDLASKEGWIHLPRARSPTGR